MVVMVMPPESAIAYALDALVLRAGIERRLHDGKIAPSTAPPTAVDFADKIMLALTTKAEPVEEPQVSRFRRSTDYEDETATPQD